MFITIILLFIITLILLRIAYSLDRIADKIAPKENDTEKAIKNIGKKVY